MKLHPNGSIEGTPEELHQYTKLQEKKEQFKVIPPNGFEEWLGNGDIRITCGTIDTKHLQPIPTLKFESYSSPADYVRGVLNAMNNKGNLH